MTTEHDKDPGAAVLWRAARRDLTAATPEDEAARTALIAGYLDGRLDAAEAARVEAWLATDSAALDLLLETRAALAATDEGPVPVREALLQRAKGIVRARPARQGKRGSPLAGVFAALWQPVGAVAAVAVLVACIAGFELGRTGYQNVAKVETMLAQQFSFGLRAEDLL